MHRRSSIAGPRAVWVAIAVAFAGLAWPATTRAQAPTPFAPPGRDTLIVYRHATLVDGTGRAAQADMDVVVTGERIARVLPDRELDPALAAKEIVVDLRGRYLIPGLIDADIHLATPPNRRQAEAVLRRDLYGGVAAVRDMADDLRAIGDEPARQPRQPAERGDDGEARPPLRAARVRPAHARRHHRLLRSSPCQDRRRSLADPTG